MQLLELFSIPWWTTPLGGWMAWTPATAAFCIFIALSIGAMSVWEYFSPGGGERLGILKLNTTRGDRLFISLLGSAFIFLGWMLLTDGLLVWALFIAIIWSIGVFRFV